MAGGSGGKNRDFQNGAKANKILNWQNGGVDGVLGPGVAGEKDEPGMFNKNTED